jgi:asparagine synthase (glutamine-hydrolysing)
MSTIYCVLRSHLANNIIDDLEKIAACFMEERPRQNRFWSAVLPQITVGLGYVSSQVTPEGDYEQQPLLSNDSQVVLVADARLDNRAELMRLLNITPEQARILSDSGFILKAYEKWSYDCPQYLLGDFVFIIWNSHTSKLFCARDHLGNRILFYYRSPSLLAIATAPRGLFALADIPRRLNETKIADFLVLSGEQTASFYQDIERLPAAHSLLADQANLSTWRYWSPDSIKQFNYASDMEYIEAFHEIFDEAVRCRLDSTLPTGVLLSGGLDSPSVASTAARQLAMSGQRLVAFTAGPRSGFSEVEASSYYNDETPYVEQIGQMWPNLDINYIHGAEHTPLDDLDHLYHVLEAPLFNPCNRSWIETALGSAQRLNLRVLLTGQNGNATISYDGFSLLPSLFLGGHWLRLMRELQRLAIQNGSSVWELFKSTVLVPLLPTTVWWRYRRWRDRLPHLWSTYSAINPKFAEQIALNERLLRLGEDPTHRLPSNGGKYRARLLSNGIIADAYDVYQAWRTHFGVELRDPTADKRVVEFCLALPESQYLRDGQSRSFIRRATEGLLPDVVRWQTRCGIQAADWYEGLQAAHDQVVTLLTRLERSDTAQRCLDLPRLRRLVENWPQDNWTDTNITREYRFLLLRGLMVGGFILWVENGGR